jgi:hypothetical protein
MSIHRDFLSKLDIAGDLLAFLWRRKLWWMYPSVGILLFFGILIVLGSTTGVGPFVYTLF